MKTVHLTKRVIEQAEFIGSADDNCLLWDEETPGLAVRIYPSGRKSFFLKYRFRGRQRWYTLGRFGDITLEEARKRSIQVRSGLYDNKDPLEEKKRLASGSTFADLAREYMERHAKPKKRSWTEDQRRLDAHILPEWRKIKLVSITRPMVANFHHKLGRHSIYEANRCLSLISLMFNLAVKWGLVDNLSNPAKGIDKFKEKSRDRWIRSDELPKLTESIKAEENPYVRAAIWLFLLTGLRRSELLKAKWSDIDWQRRELRLEETKSGEIQYVPLSQAAITLLNKVPRASENPFILPGHKIGWHLVNVSKPWLRIRKRAGMEDVRIHDLRRTVGSWLAQSGVSLLLIKDILRHKDIETTQIYARLGQSQSQAALDTHGDELMKLIDAPMITSDEEC